MRPPPPRPRPVRRRAWPWLLGVALTLVGAVVVGVYAGVAVKRHAETGHWNMPKLDDVVKVVVPPRPAPPSRIIYLEKAAITIAPGPDDASHRVSSVVASFHPDGPVQTAGWKGSASGWKKLVACVQKQFAPFAVTVTDQRPAGDDFLLVAVGGRGKDIGIGDAHATGMAPYSGAPIPKAVVFAFAKTTGHDVRATCETVAQEVGHAYGLDHEYLCSDVMSYLPACGERRFVDGDAACGEVTERPCTNGAATQNSHRQLLAILGPSPRR